MPEDSSFAALMKRLRAGDQDAARQLFHRFAERLIALARSRLSGPMRRREDPEDIVQSVFKSFFLRHAAGKFELADWDNLWAVLAVITLRKCGHHIDHLRAACRNVYREVQAPPGVEEAAESWGVIARDPTPTEAAMLAETLEEVMRTLDAREQKMLALSFEGHSILAISKQVGRSERTVQRVLERVRRKLERMCA
jgi:RNA polymerase sigma-70 factor (ECF subfamily)